MKLYFSPGACSLASHIALREAGIDAEMVRVNLMTKTLVETGADYRRIHPMGQVPALELRDGTVLTEGAAILQYIADLAPPSRLAPALGTRARYELMSLLNFIATELHKAFAPLFKPTTPDAYKELARKDVRAIEYVATRLERGPYLLGEEFTIADAYLFSVLGLSRHIGIDLGRWPNVADYMGRIVARPAVQEAMREEGLIGG